MRRALRMSFGVAVAAITFWLALADVDWPSLRAAFSAIDLGWLTASVASVFVTVTLCVRRLQTLFSAWRLAASFAAAWHVTILGQVANIIMPFRIGDGMKVVSASRLLSARTSVVASAVAVERVFDAMMLGVAATLLLTFGLAPGWAASALSGVVLAGAGVFVAFIAVAVVSHDARVKAHGEGLRLGGLRGFVLRQVSLALAGLAELRHDLLWLRLLSWSVAIPIASALTNFLVMRAFGLPVPAYGSFVLLVLLQCGNMFVAVPGGLGVSQLITVQTLALWNVGPAEALAFSLALHVISRAPKVLMAPHALSVLSASEPPLVSPESPSYTAARGSR